MVPKDLKKLIDALEDRVRVLEEELAFARQDNDRLNLELANLRFERRSITLTGNAGYMGHGYADYREGKIVA